MAARWQGDAEEEAADAEIVQTAVALMNGYATPNHPPAKRSWRCCGPHWPGSRSICPRCRWMRRTTRADAPSHAVAELPPPEPTHVAKARARRRQTASKRNDLDLEAAPSALSGIGSASEELLARLGLTRVVTCSGICLPVMMISASSGPSPSCSPVNK